MKMKFLKSFGIVESFFLLKIIIFVICLQSLLFWDYYHSIHIQHFRLPDHIQYTIQKGHSKTDKIIFNYNGNKYIADCRDISDNVGEMCHSSMIRQLNNQHFIGKEVYFFANSNA